MHNHHADATAAAKSGVPPETEPAAGPAPIEGTHSAGSHSMWLMLLCCVPMVLIAIVLLLGSFGAR